MTILERRLSELTPGERQRLLDRAGQADPELDRKVAEIIAQVRDRGDAALRELGRRFDGVEPKELEVPRSAWARARDRLDAELLNALDQAVAAIEVFHRAQLPAALEVDVRPGVRVSRRPDPLRRVGVYAPGGRAAYPSSVLMGVIPARVAGVDEVVVCSPPAPDGWPPPVVLAACALAEADRLFAVGGAGAVAALACGTETVPRVEKVVGPGNAYVTEAKRQLGSFVASDTLAGPSELLVVADGSADPDLIALELLAQAEHDPAAVVALVCTDATIAAASRAALERLVARQPRARIIREALAARGAILVADDPDAALAFAERFAPEHLLLLMDEADLVLDRIRAAGTVCVGPGSSVAFGDYLTGANHVLPTAGLARACSGLSTSDFVRWTTIQEVAGHAAAELAGPAAVLAEAEGLPAHAAAARYRARARERPPRAQRDGATVRPPVDRPRGGLARPCYEGIERYRSDRRSCDIDLSDNTNLFGVSPAAARALADPAPAATTRYPSVYADELKAAVAASLGIDPDNVATGCGSDDVIDFALRAFCEPGDVVAYPEPTFSMLPTFVRMNAARPVPVPLDPDFALAPERLVAAGGRVTYLCRPNNPTGTLFEPGAVEHVASEALGVVLVDEAYADFVDGGFATIAAASDRLLVLRTFSKAFGLAGLRVGYAVGPRPLIAELEKSRGPYKVSAVAEAAALAALREDGAWVRAIVDETRANRTRLAAELAELGVGSWPSSGNFLLVRVPPCRGGAGEFAAALRERGVAVRAFPALPGAGDCIRVTVGPWPLMDRFIEAVAAETAARSGSGSR